MKISQLKLWLLVCIMSTLQRTISALSRRKLDRTAEVKFKVLVTHPELPKSALDLLSQTCDVAICKTAPPSRSEILRKAQGVHGLLWATRERIDVELLDAVGPRLKVISVMAAAVDFVDVVEVKERGILLGYTPSVMNAAVADLALGLMIAAARRFQDGRRSIATARWENHVSWMWGQEIRDASVGFYGFGSIGRAIFSRLTGFGIREAMYTLQGQSKVKLYATEVSFNEILEKSDILFISAPLTKETMGVFNASAFKKMKKNAVLVNVANGQIINQNDLYTALKTNQIFAAGLDVMTPEPLPAHDKLMSLPNCVITPNLGFSTNRTHSDMAFLAAENLLKGLTDQKMPSPVL